MTTLDDADYISDVLPTPSGASDYNWQDAHVKKTQSNAKVAIIDRFLRDLDILIYCELSALYYMDCSIILFLLRAIIQLIFFTPKAAPFDPTRNQPFIGAIFTSNLFCIVFHYFFTHTEAGEETRGYLHGGLFIDFIGEKGPVLTLRLVCMDLLVVLVELVMLGLVVERVRTVDSTSRTERTRGMGERSGSRSESSTSSGEDDGDRQDHDAEERGVLRRDVRNASSSDRDGIELDEFGSRVVHAHTPNNDNDDDNEDNEPTDLLDHNTTTKPSHPLDAFTSGELMLVDIGLVDVIRDQWRYTPFSSSSASSPRRTTTSSSSTATTRYVPSAETAAFLRERFGLQISADGRVERIEQ